MESPILIDNQSDQRLAKVMAKVEDLAVLPHVVFKVLEISAAGSDTAGAEMEKAIVVDPGFSSKILVLANSASMGLPRKVAGIREAITFLGYRAVRNLAMTVGVYDLFVGKTDKESLRRRTWWRHSIDAAVFGRWFCRENRLSFAEEAYTCGLLHYIGKTLIDRLGEGDYENAERLTLAGFDELMAERQVFGVDHIQVGTGAAAKWGLPEMLVHGLDYVAVPTLDAPHRELRAMTALGHFIARLGTEGWSAGDAANKPVPYWALEALKIPVDRLDSIVVAGLESIAETSRAA